MAATRPLPPDGCHAVDAATLALEHHPVPADQVVQGTPSTALAALAAGTGLDLGVWEHSVGGSTDVEADEVFVVLSGRATVEVDGGPTLELGPGVVGLLEAGARTTWTVHEPLRKVYLALAPREQP